MKKLLLILLFIPALSFGANYPNDAITNIFYFNDLSKEFLGTSTRTILDINIFNKDVVDTLVYCDNYLIARNDLATSIDYRINYLCKSNIYATHNYNKYSLVAITYVNYDLTNVSTTTGQTTIIRGFTEGEIMTSLFMFLIFMTIIFILFIIMVSGIKIKK